MRLGLSACLAIAAALVAAVPAHAHHHGTGQNLCAVWHGWAGNPQPSANAPRYLVASNCGAQKRITIRTSITPGTQPQHAFPGIHRQ